jgi:hypothetical protein
MGRVLSKAGLPVPSNAGTDRRGRDQLMYQLLKKRIAVGQVYDDDAGRTRNTEVGAWQIADTCKKLVDSIPIATRDDADPERMAEFTGDDAILSAGHGLYGKLGRPSIKPKAELLEETLAPIANIQAKSMAHRFFEKNYKSPNRTFFVRRGRR